MIVYFDGAFIPAQDAVVSIDDAGLLHGDGVFETALLYRGGFLRLRQHLERFAASAAMLRLDAPAIEVLDDMLRTLVRMNALRDANLRVTLTRGTTRPLLFATARAVDPQRQQRARAGWSLVTAATTRPSVRAVPPQLKALGRTYALLARHEAAAAGADDALLLADDGRICEGPTWNIFWRVGTDLFTPALDVGVLAGVTRAIVLDLAAAAGLTPHEGAYPRAALDSADEIFATMTSTGIVSVRSLDGRALPAATPAADSLLGAYLRRLADEAALDPV